MTTASASIRGVSIWSRLYGFGSIFAKTGTNRQAELVALLGRLRP